MSDYRALYRKWRPVDFDDVCGQRSITDILKYEVANNRISHAYLFCGSRGTGKTSCAKILAKAVNCLEPKNGNPCNRCRACLSIDSGVATDVIEMDAASNNGVGNVRDMKDEITFTPAELKYRVYIIDEVHMMSGSAFNALLKTLEEPPGYVVFILATTEFHKLPTTIVSRCQRFDFRRMTMDVIIDRLKKISASEGIDLRDDGAVMIARASEGGMRDAVSLLELCAGAARPIDAELVYSTVGRGNKSTAYSLMSALIDSDYSSVYRILSDVVMTGADISVFWQELIDAYRDLIVVKNLSSPSSYLDLTDTELNTLSEVSKRTTMTKLLYHVSVLENTLSTLQRAGESKRSIAELSLTKMCDPKLEGSTQALALRIEELEKTVSRLKFGIAAAPSAADEAKPPAQPKSAERSVGSQPTETKAENKSDLSKPAVQPEQPYSSWARVVKGIAAAKPSVYAPLSKAVALRQGSDFTVKVDAFFVRIIAESAENMAIIKGLIAEAEGVDPASVRLKILPKARGEVGNLADEIENALK